MKNLKKKGLNAFIWDFTGKIASQGAGFVITIFLARLLEPSDFGLIALVMVFIGMAQVFSNMGLSSALIQRKDASQVDFSSVFYFNVAVGTLLTACLYFSAPFIAEYYQEDDLTRLLEVASLLFILNSLSSVQLVLLRKKLNYALSTKITLFASLAGGITGVALAFYGAGVWSLLAQILLTAVITNVLLWKYSNWQPGIIFSWIALKQLWGFGFRMFLSSLIENIFTRLDFLIIGKLFPLDTLGYFQRAKQFNLLVIANTSGSLMSVLFPVLSQVQDDLPRFQNIVLNAFTILCFVVSMLLGGLYLLSEEIIVFLFSEKWLPSVEYMELLLLSGFAYPLSAVLVNILTSRGDSKTILKLQILKKLLHCVNFAVLFYLGLEAFLYGLVVVSIFATSLNIYYASSEIEIKFVRFSKPMIIQLTISVLSAYLTYSVHETLDLSYLVSFLTKGLMFTFLFLGLNFLFKTKSYIAILRELSPLIKRMKWPNRSARR